VVLSAREAGHMFVFEITSEPPGVNFRTIVGPADTHPLAQLSPIRAT
jgi:hypothetical protein